MVLQTSKLDRQLRNWAFVIVGKLSGQKVLITAVPQTSRALKTKPH
jgi:hypothetical protein